MLFNSGAFFVFFPIVVATFFFAPARWRWLVLLVASAVFYAWWKPQYLALLSFSTTVGFVVGRLLSREEREGRRRALLAASLIANLGLLVFFKYLHFFFPFTRKVFDLALPVGISFYTFQTIGYAVDVYRRQYEPETHFGRFAVFVAFFPHLVAGPIMRGNRLLPQFQKTQRWDFDRVVSGLGLMAWGLFKKVVIADRAAHYVDTVYGDPGRFQGATILVVTYLFAFQLYGDFSGYSDIAVGSARVLGFDLMQNFDRPFAAPSLMQFWRRWHISFSTWFNDYVYLPLGLLLGRVRSPLLAGKRGRAVRTAVTVAVVFLLSGLWHGSRWNYVLWGAFMGAIMLVSLAAAALGKGFLRREMDRLGRTSPAEIVAPPYRLIVRIVGVVVTFHLVCASLVLFRANDLGHARALVARLPVDEHVSVVWELTHLGPAPPDAVAIDLGILVVAILALEVTQWVMAMGGERRLPPAVRWLAWSALCVTLLLAAVQSHSPFIYFAF